MAGERFHIVILEDNEPDLFMIKRSISEAGVACDIVAFDDGARALQYVNDPLSRVPDLMVLDFNVPGVEGTVVLNGVRGNPRWADVAVFMFTASQDPGDVARVKRLGADECLIKPMDLAGFAAIGRAVSDWLAKATQGQAGN
jgi:DNA-binding response OmpR family regulator